MKKINISIEKIPKRKGTRKLKGTWKVEIDQGLDVYDEEGNHIYLTPQMVKDGFVAKTAGQEMAKELLTEIHIDKDNKIV